MVVSYFLLGELTVELGYDNGEINEDDLRAMLPPEPRAGRCYGLAKDHKDFQRIPSFRPIISGSGTNTEFVSLFVDHHSKHLVRKLNSYIEDTPDFLRCLSKFDNTYIPDHVVPVCIDVVGLYTNIPHDEGIAAFRKALDSRTNKPVSTDFLIELLTLVLTKNLFEFDEQIFLQTWGTAMGPRVAPTYANIFMGAFEEYVFEEGSEHVRYIFEEFYKRFIDDGFMLWAGTEAQLERFIEYLNGLHATIKVTATYDFKTREVSFLDVLVSIRDGKVVTDLYRKLTAVCQYLLPSSCHPSFVTRNIPFSLCYRLLRIVSDPVTLNIRLHELKNMLVSRQYNSKVIDKALARIAKIDRKTALLKVEKKNTSGKVNFVVPYDPRFPPINPIVQKHFKVMNEDPHLKRVFQSGVQISYKRNRNLRELLCRAKLYPSIQNSRPKRAQTGWRRCSKNCITCIQLKTLKFPAHVSKNRRTVIDHHSGVHSRRPYIRLAEHRCTIRLLSRAVSTRVSYCKPRLLSSCKDPEYSQSWYRSNSVNVAAFEERHFANRTLDHLAAIRRRRRWSWFRRRWRSRGNSGKFRSSYGGRVVVGRSVVLVDVYWFKFVVKRRWKIR